MSLRVLGGVKHQTEHRGRKPITADFASLIERAERRRPNLVQRAIDRRLRRADQRVGPFGWTAALPLIGQRLTLRGAQLLAARVCQQPIEAAGQMLQMETD